MPTEPAVATLTGPASGSPERRPSRDFLVRLGLIVAVGVTLRVLYTVLFAPWPPAGLDDQGFYHLEPLLIAHGRGFIEPVFASIGRIVPTAEHPPLYPIVLAGLAKLGGTGDLVQRLTGSVFGAVMIVAIALLGRRLASDRAGLIAAALAAVYPILITADGALMSESLYGALVAVTLLAALALQRAPSLRRGVAVGLLLGLAALTRGEAIFLFLLVLGAVVRRPGGVRAGAVALVAFVLVLTPWTVRNATVFHRFVPISNDMGGVIGGANCDATYSGSFLGSWSYLCNHVSPGNEADEAARDQSVGISYATHHLRRVPVVVIARLERLWGLRQPTQTNSGRAPWAQNAGLVMYYLLLIPAIAGLLLLRRRRAPLWVLIAPAISVSIAAALGYGFLRLRELAEITLVVAAAIALDALWARRQARPARAGDAQSSTRSARHSVPSGHSG